MAYDIDKKLVVGVASSALFNLDAADEIFRSKGERAYRTYQRQHQNNCFKKGVAFPFIKRFLKLNDRFGEKTPVEVVLLSHNDPDTGLRVFNSIQKYNLNITRAAFLTGGSPFEYIPAFNVALFLSANTNDVDKAMSKGYAAGLVLESNIDDDDNDDELRIAFDFDGVLTDDSAEKIYQTDGIAEFHKVEQAKATIPHPPGPLKNLFQKLAYFHNMELHMQRVDPNFKRMLRISIVTARNAPAHERVVTTLREWGVSADETFFLGGIDKGRIMKTLRPHIFFDDQQGHLESIGKYTPSVHIPLIISKSK